MTDNQISGIKFPGKKKTTFELTKMKYFESLRRSWWFCWFHALVLTPPPPSRLHTQKRSHLAGSRVHDNRRETTTERVQKSSNIRNALGG